MKKVQFLTALLMTLVTSLSFANQSVLLGGELVSSSGSRLAIGCLEYSTAGGSCKNYAFFVSPNDHEGYRPVKIGKTVDFKIGDTLSGQTTKALMESEEFQKIKSVYGFHLNKDASFNVGMGLGVLVLFPPIGIVLLAMSSAQSVYLGTIDMVGNTLIKNPNLNFLFDQKYVGKEKNISSAQFADLYSSLQYL